MLFTGGRSAYRGGSTSRAVCIRGCQKPGGGSASRRAGQTPPSDTTGYGQRARDTHPTGMHFCLWSYVKSNICSHVISDGISSLYHCRQV